MHNIPRMIATGIIWLIGMLGITSLLNNLSRPIYEMVEQQTMGFNGEIHSFMAPIITGYASDGWMTVVIGFLCFFIIAGMIGSTITMWSNAHLDQRRESSAKAIAIDSDRAAETARKQKRDQQERVRRLLERMDADDLAALENGLSVGADGEVVSLDEMLRTQRR